MPATTAPPRRCPPPRRWPSRARGWSPPGLRETLGAAPVLKRVRELRGALSKQERGALASEFDALRAVLNELAKAVR